MNRNQQIKRFAELVRRYVIKGNPIENPDDLAKEFNVSRRTIYRDLEILKELILEKNSQR